jgi:outer membrane protein TolC
LVANWEIDIWHKLRTEKQACCALFVNVEGKNFVLSSLIAEVADNYYELLSLDNQLDIHQYIDLQKKALEVAKIKSRQWLQRNWPLKNSRQS